MHIYLKVIFIFTAALMPGGQTFALMSGDLNGNCRVDFADLRILAENWLSTDCTDPNCGKITADGPVNMADFAAVASNWLAIETPVLISEFMASSSDRLGDPGVLLDGNGRSSDWIEFYNTADNAVNLAGWYLTDDPENLTKWPFPGDFLIEPGGYRLVFASDVDDANYPYMDSLGLYHTNFRLGKAGEYLALVGPDGRTIAHEYASTDGGFGPQRTNYSYGIQQADPNREGYFLAPTWLRANSGEPQGIVADTKFDSDRGFYEGPVTVSIRTDTPDAIIRYTLDGTEPSAYSGHVYTGPITISSTVSLRAAAFKPGFLPTNVDTHTYVIAASEAIRSLPVISIATDSDNLYGSEDGILANPTGRGVQWERPVSVELIEPADNSGFQEDCGIRLHGSNYRRDRINVNSKASFRLYFSNDYGSKRLKYPVIPRSGIDKYKYLVLRSGYNDPTNPFIKDELGRRLHKDMGSVVANGTFAHLFINGRYKGYYNPTERIAEPMLQQHFDTDLEWDVVKYWKPGDGGPDRTYSFDVREGDGQSFTELLDYASNNDLSEPEHYAYVEKRLDIEAFVDYLLLQGYLYIHDWPHNNWNAARARTTGELGKWRFYAWDVEFGFLSGDLTRGFKAPPSLTWKDGIVPISLLYLNLKDSPEFKQTFADRVQKHCFNGGALTGENVVKRFDELYAGVDTAIYAKTGRHMQTFIRNTWAPARCGHVVGSLEWLGLFTFEGPAFNINGSAQHGGYIQSGDMLTMVNDEGAGRIYYTLNGDDPRQPSEIRDIETWSLIAENAPKRFLVPTGPVPDNWKGGGVYDDSNWRSVSGGPGGIGYDRRSDYDYLISGDVGTEMYGINASCYIRIPFEAAAVQTAAMSQLTLSVRYDDAFVAYLNGQEVRRENFTEAPLWNSRASTHHPDTESEVFREYDISRYVDLIKPGENVLAVHGLNIQPDSSDFLISVKLSGSSGGGAEISPAAVEYTGPFTLERTTRVKARILDGGTFSGLTEAVFAVRQVSQSLRITELMYHPADQNDANDPNEEFIEFTNVGAESINLALVRFRRGIQFAFEDTVLEPGEHALIVEDMEAFKARYGSELNIAGEYSGSLDNGGERVRLEDGLGGVIDDFRYRDGWYDITDGLGFSLTVRDSSADPNSLSEKKLWRPSASVGGSPGYDDTGAVPAPGSVKINEVLAHSHGQASDWIELHNTTAVPMNIGGWFISDSWANLRKYEVADGTVIPANGFAVFYEDTHFGSASDPGAREPFALSENGETIYVHSGSDGELTGYSEDEQFDASQTNVAFGRYRKSTGTYNFVAMSQNTPGQPNSGPKVGPVVISEIMYHPPAEADAEYVELRNITDHAVNLFDYDSEIGDFVPWRLTDSDGIEWYFPPQTVIPANGLILLVKDLAVFTAVYGRIPPVQVFEWGSGKLDNAGDKVQLCRPGDLDPLNGDRYYIRVDRVNYSDGSHPVGGDPWPAAADGFGLTLQKNSPEVYGNDVANWSAAAPTPGAL